LGKANKKRVDFRLVVDFHFLIINKTPGP